MLPAPAKQTFAGGAGVAGRKRPAPAGAPPCFYLEKFGFLKYTPQSGKDLFLSSYCLCLKNT
jgi:hypothetical protein